MTEATQGERIAAWKRYGVEFEQDTAGHWQWFEPDPETGEAGIFSPYFATFEQCEGDVKSCFGECPELR